MKFEDKNGTLYIEGKKVIRAFESFSGWYWFAVEIAEVRSKNADSGSVINGQVVDDVIYYGLVQGFEEEWGRFSLAEMMPLIKEGKIWEIKKVDLPFAGRR